MFPRSMLIRQEIQVYEEIYNGIRGKGWNRSYCTVENIHYLKNDFDRSSDVSL